MGGGRAVGPTPDLFAAGIVGVLICLYLLVLRKEKTATAPRIVRIAYWLGMIVSAATVVWGIVSFFG